MRCIWSSCSCSVCSIKSHICLLGEAFETLHEISFVICLFPMGRTGWKEKHRGRGEWNRWFAQKWIDGGVERLEWRRGKEEEKTRKRADWVSGAEGGGVTDLCKRRWYKRRACGTQKLLVGERRGIIDCEHRHPAQPITELHTDFSGLEHLHSRRGVKWTKEQWWKRGGRKQTLKTGWRA